jgi:hypothetical protein
MFDLKGRFLAAALRSIPEQDAFLFGQQPIERFAKL